MIVRNIGTAGRIVLPHQFLDALQLQNGDRIEIGLDAAAKRIIIAPAKRRCPICSRETQLREIAGSAICPACICKIVKAAGN